MNESLEYFLQQHFCDHEEFDLNQLHRVFKYLTQECNVDIFGKDEEVFVNALNNVDEDIIEIYRRINPLEEDNPYTTFLKKCTTIKDLFMVSRTLEIEKQIQDKRGIDCNYHNLTMELFDAITSNRLRYDIVKIHQCYKEVFIASKMHVWKCKNDDLD